MAAMFQAYAMLAMLLHPSLETVTELQWDPATKRVECALRLSLVDEQDVLRDYRKRWKTAAKTNGLDRFDRSLAQRVLADTVIFETKVPKVDAKNQEDSRKLQPYHVIGRQRDGGHVWWFFEYEVTTPQAGYVQPPNSVRIRILDRIASVHTHRAPHRDSPSNDGATDSTNLTVARNAIRILGKDEPWVVTAAGSEKVTLVWPAQTE